MNQIRNYRSALFVTVSLNVVLALVLGLVWWRHHPVPSGIASSSASQSSQGAAMSTASDPNPAATPEGMPAASETPLVPIQLSPQRLQSIGVKMGTVEIKSMDSEIRATGTVDTDERRLAYVQVRFPGWIRKVYANATYQYIRKGEALFTIYSPDLVATEQEYLLARKNRDQLQTSTVSGVASGAESLVGAAQARLEQWEVPQSEMTKLETTGKVITDLTFNSPVSGYITERNALPNMYVQPETRLYSVADLSTVWVYVQAFQNDIGKVKPGDVALVTVDAYPGKTFAGRVAQILPQVDMNTRTVRVRLVFRNPGLKLKPGMYVNAILKKSMGQQMVIPASAVFQSGLRQLVFVNHGEGNLEPREVEVGERVGDSYVVMKGLKAHDSIITSANFLIDSESQLQAAAGAFVPPPPGSGGTVAMNDSSNTPKSAPQPTVDFSTDPSPPHKGNNTFRVKLTSADGTPLTGVQVSIGSFMPAMAAMGMAAMRGQATLTEKGNGVYEGRSELATGGTWQITITVSKGGQVLATKHLSVNAEGGM